MKMVNIKKRVIDLIQAFEFKSSEELKLDFYGAEHNLEYVGQNIDIFSAFETVRRGKFLTHLIFLC